MTMTAAISVLVTLLSLQATPPAATPPAARPPAATPPASQPATPPKTPPQTPPATPTPTPPPSTPPTPPPGPPPAAPGELRAKFFTPKGTFIVQLRTEEAPTACANFINLIQRKYYNDQPINSWTRVLRQVTGPVGLKYAGYGIRREFSPKLFFDGPGRVALQRMNSSDEAHATIFFITTKEQARWNLEMPVFGLVIFGQDVVDALMLNDHIDHIEVVGDPATLLKRFGTDIPKWNSALDAAIKAAADEAAKQPKTPAAKTPVTSPGH